ncbi:MGMT family protein [Leifsonia sp. AG29]|uniref:MGMT family protein n=1 Tax=Leifsonia sp. AG29 TaxID=2598860 RepID=UPI0018EEF770|nr:MGMT family protein [Leifsonia sp. AG29]
MPSTSEEAPGRDPDTFVERVLDVVDSIPSGRVMTYGDVAAALGSRAARMVGQIMAYYGGDVPWWRVVRADGRPAQNHEHIALQHYRAEGTALRGGEGRPYRVDLAIARHRPSL